MIDLYQLAHFKKLNLAHLRTRKIIGIVRGCILSGLVVCFWAYLRPVQGMEQFILGLICLSISLWISISEPEANTSESSLRVALDMKYPQLSSDPFEDTALSSREWQSVIKNELEQKARDLRHLNLSYATTLVPLICLFAALVFFAPQGVSTAINNASRAVANLSWGASLRIVEGKSKESDPDIYALSKSKPQTIELTSENLIEVKVSRPFTNKNEPLTLELRSKKEGKEDLYQSFQLNLDSSEGDQASFKLAVTVPVSVSLYLPSISSSALAQLDVKALPYPDVQISTDAQFNEPWPDDQPLKIKINAHAEHPLKLVRLVIVSGKKRSEELVSNVLATDMHDVLTSYNLVLSPYVESDIADVEIYAEAVDRSIPKPLLGRSNSLSLKTSSAYGRYRQTLQTLRDLKEITDKALQESKDGLDAKAMELVSSAEKQAETSPYFDGLDRVAIDTFKNEVTDIIAAQNLERVAELSEALNQFLFEHEMIDDRERDRDFFVAVRSLSRILEKDPDERGIDFKKAAERMKSFLDDRHKRWELRTKRLEAAFQPKQWPEIRSQKPFHRNIDKVVTLDSQSDVRNRQEALVLLSQSSATYRGWIEELEKSEDQARQEAEKKRQEGLASARNALKELQQRQGEISQTLDRAASQNKEDLKQQWPAVRAKQNSNASATKQLEGQLRSLAPSAAERIKLAVESMQLVLTNGNDQHFEPAESSSDLAVRLLRQAESAAQRAQQNGNQQRPRRYTPSDSHFGQTIVGDVEISHEYEVDAKYRDAILQEAQDSISNGDVTQGSQESKILDEYLRQIVR